MEQQYMNPAAVAERRRPQIADATVLLLLPPKLWRGKPWPTSRRSKGGGHDLPLTSAAAWRPRPEPYAKNYFRQELLQLLQPVVLL